MKGKTMRCPSCGGGNLDGKGGSDKKGPYFDAIGCRDCDYTMKGVKLYLFDMERGDNNLR